MKENLNIYYNFEIKFNEFYTIEIRKDKTWNNY